MLASVSLKTWFMYVVWMWVFIKATHTHTHNNHIRKFYNLLYIQQKSFLPDSQELSTLSSLCCPHHLTPLFVHWGHSESAWWTDFLMDYSKIATLGEIEVLDAAGWILQSLYTQLMCD